jgi:hypothetical protein
MKNTTETAILNVKGVKLLVDFTLEEFNIHEYQETGYGGGIQIEGIFPEPGEDISPLIDFKVSMREIEESLLEYLEKESHV